MPNMDTLPVIFKKIVAAFRGMHVSPAKQSYVSVTDGQTDGQADEGQSDPYVSLCFAGDTKIPQKFMFSKYDLLKIRPKVKVVDVNGKVCNQTPSYLA